VNMEKALDSAVGDAATSRSSAASMEELASRWETDKPTPGIFGSAQSTWNKMTGSDTGLRDLRIRTSQFLNSQALKYLPPGPATNRDIELARAPFPTEKSSPQYVANWLGAISRLNQKRAEYAEFKANFIGSNGTVRDKSGKSLATAWKEAQTGNAAPNVTKQDMAAPDGWSIKPVGGK